MSFSNFEDSAPWAIPAAPSSGDIIQDAIKKDKLVKDITAAQDDLRVLVGRIQDVQNDIDKLTSGNATLQMYIDNLTKQMAKRRG